MPNINELEEMPRRALNIFYVLDTSGSMQGTPIGMLNSAMTETVNVLGEQAKKNADALLKIAVLEFNSSPRWINPNGPEEASDFIWQPLEAGATTDLGLALKELNDKLSKDKFLQSDTGAYLPIIIFMTDGTPTDDYRKELAKIRENRWFKRATKIGFAIGDCDKETIAEIVGNTEAVLSTDDLELFSRLIKFVSTTASMLCSSSKTSDVDVSGVDIVKMAIDNEDDSSNLDTDFDYEVENLPDTDDFDDADFDDVWGDNSGW